MERISACALAQQERKNEMPSISKTIIMGHLGRDPELEHTKTGTPKVKMGIATTYKRAGEEETVWHNCHFFGKDAENFAKMATKGGLCYVEGRLFYTTWTDRDGNEKKGHGISVYSWQYIGKRSAEGQSFGASNFNQGKSISHIEDDEFADDDLPF